MKTRNIFLSVFTVLAILAMGFASCSKTDSNRAGQFRVLLTDAPGDYIGAQIDIVKVEAKVDNDKEHSKDDHFGDGDRHEDDHNRRKDEFGEWIDLNFNAGVIDVMTLRNGVDAKIAEGNIVGTVRKVRVTLGPNNKVTTKDGIVHDLVLQNETENYIYVHLNNEHRGHGREQHAAQDQEVVIDFDVARSIVEVNGVYYLKPKVRPFHDQNAGAIEGKVLPANIFAVVTAIDASGAEVAKALPKPDGEYKIRGLADGTYTLKFEASGYQNQNTTVTAEKGKCVKVNTITLTK